MEAYIYGAEIFCKKCGEDIVRRLTEEGKAPEEPDKEYTYDSDDFPKGPIANGGGESDHPEHCGNGKCNEFLENPLTEEGVDYVKEAYMEGGIPEEWHKFYDYIEWEEE